MFRLGSLFSGSGGFELAASLCRIEPVFAAEVEPYPIAVTRSRFPGMKHLGSVTDVHGGYIEPVDIITFGSPCQDLSVAGKRAGLKHEANGDEETTRSGLFMEAVRIIREMRESTNGRYPTFALWENVPGAFSSNNGEDFRIVLEELIKIAEPSAIMPEVPKGGWPYADSYCGDGWSVAYRVLDAQYWGVPQRRRRIYLVADFRGQRAGEVLFEREGLRGDFEKGRTPWQGAAGDAADCAGADDCDGEGNGIADCIPINTMIATRHKQLGRGTGFGVGEAGEPQFTISAGHEHAVAYKVVLDDQGGSQISVRTDGKAPTLRAETHGNLPCVLEAAGFKAGQGAQARSIGWEDEKCPTLAAEAGGNSVPSVCVKCYDARGNGDGQTVSTLTGDHENRITDYTTVIRLQGNGIDRADTAGCNGKGWRENECYTLNTIDRSAVAYCMAHGQANAEICEEKSPCLNCNHEQPIVFDKEVYNFGINATGGHYISDRGIAPSLRTGCPPGVCIRYIVRRITPTECARLQGFPDNWGHPNPKENFTEEEYRFWLNVRNTHAEINGKATKEYTKAQMLSWYNKPHTDSSEYKMWGNGIALPCALYVMQGITEAMKNNSKTEG